MVADIGHRYISEGAKGSALEHKKIARLIEKTVTTPPPSPSTAATTDLPLTLLRRSQPPSDLWSILYIRYFLLSIAPICLIYVSFRDHPRSPHAVSALAWPASTPFRPSGRRHRPLSRAKFTPAPTDTDGRGRATTGYSEGFARDANAPLY